MGNSSSSVANKGVYVSEPDNGDTTPLNGT